MLTLFKERGWLKERQKQRTASTHILAKIRAINRLLCVGEAMRFAPPQSRGRCRRLVTGAQ